MIRAAVVDLASSTNPEYHDVGRVDERQREDVQRRQETEITDFPTVDAFQDTNLAAEAGDPIPRMAFAARILANGSAIAYATYLGGSGDDVCYDMDINSAGHMFLAGRTSSDDLPVRDAWQAYRSASSSDALVARIDPFQTGDASLVYCTYAGGAGTDFAYGIAIDDDDNAYVTGVTSGVTAA